MNKVLGFLTLSVGLALLKAAIVAVVAALMLAIVISVITRPRETILFAGTCALSCVAVAQPVACVIGVTVVGVVLVVAGSTRKPRSGLLLTGKG